MKTIVPVCWVLVGCAILVGLLGINLTGSHADQVDHKLVQTLPKDFIELPKDFIELPKDFIELPKEIIELAACASRDVYSAVEADNAFSKVLKDDKRGEYIQSMARFDPGSSTLFMAFRGTSDFRDMINDLMCTPMPAFKSGPISAYVHSGAYRRAATWIRAHLAAVFAEHHRSNLKTVPIHRIVFCGHSLGGAYAQIALMEIQASRFTNQSFEFHMSGTLVDNSFAISFGAPQPFQMGMTEVLARQMQRRHLAIVHGNDPVPRLPGKAASLFDPPVRGADLWRMSTIVARTCSWLASPLVRRVQSYIKSQEVMGQYTPHGYTVHASRDDSGLSVHQIGTEVDLAWVSSPDWFIKHHSMANYMDIATQIAALDREVLQAPCMLSFRIMSRLSSTQFATFLPWLWIFGLVCLIIKLA